MVFPFLFSQMMLGSTPCLGANVAGASDERVNRGFQQQLKNI